MGNRPLETPLPDGELKVKGYGLLIYGGMMAVAGGILAEKHPGFIVLAVLGLIVLIVGVRACVQRVLQRRISRPRLWDEEL